VGTVEGVEEKEGVGGDEGKFFSTPAGGRGLLQLPRYTTNLCCNLLLCFEGCEYTITFYTVRGKLMENITQVYSLSL
jgi:hypothetical protein